MKFKYSGEFCGNNNKKSTFSGDNIVKKKMIADGRSVGVKRTAFFITVLIQGEIHKAFVGKYMEQGLCHIYTSFNIENYAILIKNKSKNCDI